MSIHSLRSLPSAKTKNEQAVRISGYALSFWPRFHDHNGTNLHAPSTQAPSEQAPETHKMLVCWVIEWSFQNS
jgi:hypothetical protein